MSRAPSLETQLTTARRQLRQCHGELTKTRQDMLMYQTRCTHHEHTIAEWKRRFDALLRILPPRSNAALDEQGEKK